MNGSGSGVWLRGELVYSVCTVCQVGAGTISSRGLCGVFCVTGRCVVTQRCRRHAPPTLRGVTSSALSCTQFLLLSRCHAGGVPRLPSITANSWMPPRRQDSVSVCSRAARMKSFDLKEPAGSHNRRHLLHSHPGGAVVQSHPGTASISFYKKKKSLSDARGRAVHSELRWLSISHNFFRI